MVRAAAAGTAYVSSDVMPLFADARLHHGAVGALGEREREVIKALADGRTVAEIAERLHLSQHTVRNHIRRAMQPRGPPPPRRGGRRRTRRDDRAVVVSAPTTADDADLATAATDVELFTGVFGRSTAPVAVVRMASGSSVVIAANEALRTAARPRRRRRADLATISGPDRPPAGRDTIERSVRTRSTLFRRRRSNYRRTTARTSRSGCSASCIESGTGGALVAALRRRRDGWIDERRIHHDDELKAALAEVRAALLRGDPTDVVLDLICTGRADLLGAENAGILRAEGPEQRARSWPPGNPVPTLAGGSGRSSTTTSAPRCGPLRATRYTVPRRRSPRPAPRSPCPPTIRVGSTWRWRRSRRPGPVSVRSWSGGPHRSSTRPTWRSWRLFADGVSDALDGGRDHRPTSSGCGCSRSASRSPGTCTTR